MGINFYEASVRERIELYVEEIENEIRENERLIQTYAKSEKAQIEVLQYFKQRLQKLKKDFETTKRILEQL